MRGPDAPNPRRLAGSLPLNEVDGTPARGTLEAASEAWSAYLRGDVVIAPSMESARVWLFDVLGITRRERTEVLPTSTGDLEDQIRSVAPAVQVIDLDRMLRARQKQGTLAWLQTPSGFEAGPVHRAVIERRESLPVDGALRAMPRGCLAVIWPLALTNDSAHSGALVGLSPELARQIQSAGHALRLNTDRDLGGRALRQLQRWRMLVPLQQAAVERTWSGLHGAAGLRMPRLASLSGIDVPGSVPVQIPSEVDPATFFAYVAREGTPVSWLPLEHPLHFRVAQRVGAQAARRIAQRMARWLLIPVSPDDSMQDTEQSVLGVVKAAEYLGVRWRAEPVRAAAYARLLEQWYGTDHDAFRPVFPVDRFEGQSEFLW